MFDYNLVQNMVKNSECETSPNNLKECDKALSQKVKLCTDLGEVIYKFTSATTTACEASFHVLRPGKRASKDEACHGGIMNLQHFAKKPLL
jgi:hypothetical protein